MKSLLASGCVAVTLLAAPPSHAQIDVGSGLVGAGAGAAIGAIAGGGRGAATGAMVGGAVGAATGAFRPAPTYAYPYSGGGYYAYPQRHYARYSGCHWVPAHYNRWGRWVSGHCAH
jgi:YmgG-like glycine-zipper protein